MLPPASPIVHQDQGWDWRRRPDLNRGWRFCRFRRVLQVVESSCSLVSGAPRFSGVFGRSWTEVGLTFRRPRVASDACQAARHRVSLRPSTRPRLARGPFDASAFHINIGENSHSERKLSTTFWRPVNGRTRCSGFGPARSPARPCGKAERVVRRGRGRKEEARRDISIGTDHAVAAIPLDV